MSELVLTQASAGALLHADWRFGPGVTLVLGDDARALDALVGVASGVLMPTRGRALLDGMSLAFAPHARRTLASLLADETLPPARHVAEAVARILEARGERSEPRTLLEAFGLARWAARRPAELDWDERRSLALALALAHARASACVLYEPFGTSSIDPRAVTAGIERVVSRGGLALLCTSSPGSVAGVSGVTVWLERGVLRAEPSVEAAPVAPAPAPEVGPRPENQVVSMPTAFANPTRPPDSGGAT